MLRAVLRLALREAEGGITKTLFFFFLGGVTEAASWKYSDLILQIAP